jgi:hypothetical protein
LVLAIGLTALSLLGCANVDRGQKPARIEVHWSGSERGNMGVNATAEWCAALRLLEIQAVAGDSGVALAIYPSDSLVAGRYGVVAPARADSVRPAAALALRWRGPTSVKGFQSDTGSVVLRRTASGVLSGTLITRARSVVDTGRVDVSGSFENLQVRPASRGCVPPPRDTAQADTGKRAPGTDTLVH